MSQKLVTINKCKKLQKCVFNFINNWQSVLFFVAYWLIVVLAICTQAFCLKNTKVRGFYGYILAKMVVQIKAFFFVK